MSYHTMALVAFIELQVYVFLSIILAPFADA